ncbi:redoxin domain-containing protein [Lacipirellula sp.]|uniref:redoxin domain-containing protein n=1 Tax=Lacipirellula sp. TaxID=2691419 RepID=UPI003D110084
MRSVLFVGGNFLSRCGAVLLTVALAWPSAVVAQTPTATAAGKEEKAAAKETSAPALSDPTILLVRDAAVRKALQLTGEQRTSLDALLRTHNRMLLAIRDVGPTGADETAQPALAEIRAELNKILNAKQKLRLQQLVLQVQGYDCLARQDVARQLKLSPEQQQRLAQIGDEFRASVKAFTEGGGGGDAEANAAELARLQAARLEKILAELEEPQEAAFSKLLGEQFNFAQVNPSPADAPEFVSIEEWVNSEPLTMESLRGKVVVVHFFAFGCINCIHNYPWYREWQEAYQGKDVALIGIHTPETETEEDNAKLKASLVKNDLKFPVAVDKEKAMWKAWYNGIWPSVYIIDKQGRVRYWWYGELDWKGAGNQKVARQQIEKLLAEKYVEQAEKSGELTADKR